MNTKLTLRLDESLINGAKKYAAREGRSVSELVAAYFKRLDTPAVDTTSSEKGQTDNHRKSSFYGLLSGAKNALQEIDEAAYRAHLARKHK